MRGLTTREKRLLGLCVLSIFLVANLFAARAISRSLGGGKEKIRTLEQELAENEMWLEEKELWDRRKAWLDQNLPPSLVRQRISTGNAQGNLMQGLQNELLELKLKIDRQTLVEPKTTDFYDEVAVYLRIEGDAAKVNNWLATLQSPDKFQVIKSLELELDGRSREVEPQAECEITIARWFAPSAGEVISPEDTTAPAPTPTTESTEPSPTPNPEPAPVPTPAPAEPTPTPEPVPNPAPATPGTESESTETTPPASTEKEKVELTGRS